MVDDSRSRTVAGTPFLRVTIAAAAAISDRELGNSCCAGDRAARAGGGRSQINRVARVAREPASVVRAFSGGSYVQRGVSRRFIQDGASGWEAWRGCFLFAIGVYVFLYTLAGPRDAGSDPLAFARLVFVVGLAGAIFACADFYFQWPAPAGYGAQFVWLAHSVMRRAQGVFYEASTLGNFCAFFLTMILVACFPAVKPTI